MELTRLEWIALACAGLVAAAMPAVLLTRTPNGEAVGATLSEPLANPPAPPPLTAVYTRQLFVTGAAPSENAQLPADVPQLLGIVGRIGSDAVALVRGTDGKTRTLSVGEGVEGWTLESLAIDAAFFTRGEQKARVPLPAG